MDVALDEEFTNFIPGFENLDVGNVSSYLVEGLEPNTCYYYRIMAYYLMGKSEQYSDTVEVQTISTDISENNNEIVLLSIYPNPVNSHTTIEFYLESATSVQLAIVDITGRIVYEAEDSDTQSGKNQISFQARNLPAGLYLCRLRVGTEMIIKKIIKY